MKKRDLLRSLMAIVVALTFMLCSASTVALAKGDGPYLAKDKMTVKIGQIAGVQVRNLPSGATVTYKSSNSKVLEVSKKGKLTPKKTGKAVIRATVKNNGKRKTLKCKVTVKQAVVAVIDGGAAKGQKVWKALKTSSAGAYGPANGHAKRMIDVIKDEAPKAKILSIKVTDAADRSISNAGVIKALKLAKKYQASVVYYSFYGPEPDEEEYELVCELIANGTRIVGPAGNSSGADARKQAWLTNQKGADCVGAWGNGKILATSNKHGNLYVTAGSTSAAAARYAGMLANGKTYDVHKK